MGLKKKKQGSSCNPQLTDWLTQDVTQAAVVSVLSEVLATVSDFWKNKQTKNTHALQYL